MTKPETRIHPAAFAMLAIMFVVLLIPSALIVRSDEDNLAAYHRRALAPAPQITALAEEPKAFFIALQAWHADRIGFGVRAGRLYRRVSYFLFSDSPVKNIERGADDFVFLVSHGRGARMSSVADSCPDQADWPGTSEHLVEDWRSIHGALKVRGITPNLLIIPSKKTLYAEHLPKSVPRGLRSRCLNMRSPGNPIEHLAGVHAQSVIDAYPALAPFKNRPHFFPPENFHADGESAMRAVSAALIAMGYLMPRSSAHKRFKAVPSNADLSGVVGFQRQIHLEEPIGFDKTQLEKDEAYTEFIAEMFGSGVYARRYQNPDAPHKRSVLLITNSFGIRVGPYFSSAFETVDQISTNRLISVGARVRLFEEIVFRGTHDEVVFIFHDESLLKGRLGHYAEALARL